MEERKMRNNVYEVIYDESKAASLSKESEEYKAALTEAQSVAHLVTASNLRSALDKAESQNLTFFKVSDLKLLKSNVNVL
jgi:hypothetical protein